MSKNQCLHFFSVSIELILFKLAEKEKMHNILDVFEFDHCSFVLGVDDFQTIEKPALLE